MVEKKLYGSNIFNNKEQCIMGGNRIHDIIGAKLNSIESIFALYMVTAE